MPKRVSKTREAKIRRDLEHLVEDRLLELGVEGFVSYSRVHRDRENMFDGSLCTLVNPACPDDLCYLPYGHIGSEEGYHITGTVSYAYAEQWWFSGRAPEGTSRYALIQCGARMARRLEGEPDVKAIDLEKLMNMCLGVCQLPACGCDGTPHEM